MRVIAADRVREGRVVDLRGSGLSAASVAAAVRGESSDVTVEAPSPGQVHERVGYVRRGMTVATRTALAAAARSLGHDAPQDDRIAALERELDELTVPDVSRRDVREREADAAAETDRLRERVAELRGRAQALREQGADASEAEAELENATARLAAAETERIAAGQRLDGTTEATRAARDERERRFRLEDELANRRRAARRQLVEQVEADYRRAIAALPWSVPGDALEADGVHAALGVLRVAAVEAPVLLACDRFETPERAASWLDAPVLRL